jgi:nitrite reductase/ring-hydroxylating ferredoxin subunit
MTEAMVLAGRVQDLPQGRGVLVGHDGREVALFNVNGEYRAVDNRCLHEGGPICRGRVVNWTVTCPRHHWHYDLRTGEAIGRPGRRLRCYPVEVHGDQVYIRMPRRGALSGIQELLRGLAHVG